MAGGDVNNEKKLKLTSSITGESDDEVIFAAGTGLSLSRNGDKITFANTDTGSGANTTYDLTVEQTGGTNDNPSIKLNASGSGDDDEITITGGTNISVTRNSSTQLTIATSATLSGTTSQANTVRIKTANGDEYKNITFVDRDVANNNYDDIKIDNEDDKLAYNPSANILKTANITVTGNTILQGELNLIGSSNTDKYIDCRTGDNNALHIRSTAGGDANHEEMAIFRRNAEVALYFDNGERFRTQSGGTIRS